MSKRPLRPPRVALLVFAVLITFGIGVPSLGSSAPAASGAQQTQAPAALYASAPYDLQSFELELRRIGASLRQIHGTRDDLAAIRSSLPVEWRVNAPDHQFEISSEPLRSLLLDAERNPKEQHARVVDAENWLEHLTNQVETYNAPAADNQVAREDLDKILSRREFAAVRPPNEWDKLKQKVNAWLARLIAKLLGKIGQHPLGAKVLFWLLIAAAVAWIAMMLFRFWGGRARMEEMASIENVAARKSWQEWIRAARLAADRGNFREAVHSCYWAGIAYLEDLGAIAVDRTRTPREYLRLIDESENAQPADRAQRRDSLAGLTSRLERIWYGLRPAAQQDFQDSMQLLEKLGCRWQ